MNLKTMVPILTAVVLTFPALLLQATPTFASDNITVNVNVEQTVTVDQGTSAPPPAPPAPIPVPPVQPPPAPPSWHLPPPAPVVQPVPMHYPGYPWPYGYRWSTYVAPRVIIVERPVPVVQVQTLPEPVAQPQVNIDPPPVINTFTADPHNIQQGQTVSLTWTVSDVLQRDIQVTISPNIGSVASSGSVSVSPGATTTYTLTATNVDGSVSANATVTVNPAVAAVTGTTDTGTTGGFNGLDGNLWMYALLLGLLAIASGVVVFLITRRKPRVAGKSALTGYQPGSEAGTRPGTVHNPGEARLMTADGEFVPIKGNAVSLGRDDFLSMLKPAKAGLISRKHLHVECKNDGYYVEDGNSTNGTRINGAVITGKGRQPLKNNDMIDLGGVLTLTFVT